MKNYVLVVIWFLVTITIFSLFTSALTAANTFVNIIGLIICFGWMGISYKTNCFTKFKNNEKSN